MGDVVNKESMHLGFAPSYICGIPGFLRILNIALGIICFGLWLPGYEHQFLGERINVITGDTEKGYGNGWKRESLNQFVLASIIIALFVSLIFFLAILFVQNAASDWNRCNKFIHLALGIMLFVTGICSALGVWYFNENCCHVTMVWEGTGLAFDITGGDDYYYIRHCYCYLTKYLGQTYHDTVKETVLYDATKGTDLTGLDNRWTFAAHDLFPHVAAIFIIFLNSLVYLAAFIFSKPKHA